MIRLLADENVNGRVLRGVWRILPGADILRVQDSEVYQAADPLVLEWAAREGRILLTQDVETMVGFAYERLVAGLSLPGVLVLRDTVPLRIAVESLSTVFGASDASDWENLVVFLPM